MGRKYFAKSYLIMSFHPIMVTGRAEGDDAAPYFRIFNPFIQQKKFDKECDM